jgi:beta-galactosidase
MWPVIFRTGSTLSRPPDEGLEPRPWLTSVLEESFLQRVRFNDGWSFRPKVNRFEELAGRSSPYEPIELPHDAMLSTTRHPTAAAAGGYFPPGEWEYSKTFAVASELVGKRVFLHFEGVYRSALVSVNGIRAGHRPYGYSGFTLRIDELIRVGEDNTLHVECLAGNDTRWYSGAGIYRNVHLLLGPPVRIAVDGLRVSTLSIADRSAVVEVITKVENDSETSARRELVTTLTGPNGETVAHDRTPVTSWPGRPQMVRQQLTVPTATLWSVDDPALHTCTVVLSDGEEEHDRAVTTFGIRTLELDAIQGLRINGSPITLRGACVHHDNGVIGAATIERAEERRVQMLREAGFNALRSAHNPMSEAMLDACDRIGMLVMDESFDTWTEPKMPYDYARSFGEWWASDIEAMVVKDINHPCVVMYSIGNEIPELGRPDGARRNRELAEYVRSLDPTRYVTNGVNPVHTVGAELFMSADVPPMPEMGVNSLMSIMQDYLPMALRAPLVDERLEESFAALDIAGYNYLESRYELDREGHPNRVIVGTETMPPLIGRYWGLIRDNAHVIGDFSWSGWDYLGESGLGRLDRGDPAGEGMGTLANFPWLLAGTGDIDITGHRRPISFLREIVYGLRTDPYIAVQNPASHGVPIAHQSPWCLTDAVSSWSWPGCEGEPVTIEVYADADEVELFIAGESVGRAPAGEAVEYRSMFEAIYSAGVIEAIAYRDRREVGRTSLSSAGGECILRVMADRSVLRFDGTDLAFLSIELTDADGVVHTAADRRVTLTVEGPGALQGFGSAAPCTEESFVDDVHATYQGRALGVIRPTGAGSITITANADGCEPAIVALRSVDGSLDPL